MKISQSMDLDRLAERIGRYATREDAKIIRDQLLKGAWPDTESVPEYIWSRIVEESLK